MSLPLVFHPEVKFEIKESYLWYESIKEGLGESLLHELESSYPIIQEAPQIWPKFRSIYHKYLLKKFPFSILYSIEESQVTVYAVAHYSRRPYYWKDRPSSIASG